MNLILEVVSPAIAPPGCERRKVFGAQGGRIGRAPECDWVLPSPYISRHHATVSCIAGAYYIESTGENGVAVNDAQSLLEQQERRELKHGDLLFMDEFEVRVALTASPPLHANAADASSDPLEPSTAELDPLQWLGNGAPASSRAPAPSGLSSALSMGSSAAPPPAWNQSSIVSDHFAPPAPASLPVHEDWNQTVFDSSELQSLAPSPPPPPKRLVGDNWAQTSAHGSAPSPSRAPTKPPPIVDDWNPPSNDSALLPPLPGRTPTRLQPPPENPSTQQPAARSSSSVQQQAASAPSTQPRASGEHIDFDAVLRQIGVDPASIAPDTAQALEAIVQSVLQGIIDVLRARAQFRNQLRLPTARVRSTRNNPFDFAVNAQDALGSLLDASNPGYLPAAEAFAEAFRDIRSHELATLAGIRAGFQSVARLFDPQALQERFDGQLRHAGFLPFGAKLRYWEMYADFFEQLQGDADGAFQRMFGQAFADAYARQMQALRPPSDKL